jgi:hypothetical protein
VFRGALRKGRRSNAVCFTYPSDNYLSYTF